jgi:mono/diheme cytochrome c family protein
MRVANWVTATLASIVLGAGAFVLLGGETSSTVFAQMDQPAPTAKPAPAPPPYTPPATIDWYDRNARIWANKRAGAESGWERGRELYYMNCWMCHNEYVIAADTFPAPSLRDVAKRLTDEQILVIVRNGSARMPAFRHHLTDADIKDLISLFREKCGTFPTGGGCFDEHNPPPNPDYRGPKPTS